MSQSASALNLEIVEIPLFPLPKVVFFPRTLLPLHIFERRYRQMVRDSMDGERQIGMVLMKDDGQIGIESWYSVGGVGKITEFRRVDGGKFDILLTGFSRFQIIEVVRQQPYRVAKVQLLAEDPPPAELQTDLSNQLIRSFLALTRNFPQGFDPEVLEQLDFPTLLNSICAAVQIDELSKQTLLETDSLEARAHEILRILQGLRSQQRLVSQFEHLRPEDARTN